ncbi:hypothetical protein [Nocardia sp. NPDC005366]|uniref:hypothetical protein n=1 Tax=Nocardia sp. NPDC005366 TaxID=3156878 RepID=UPI0033BA89D6
MPDLSASEREAARAAALAALEGPSGASRPAAVRAALIVVGVIAAVAFMTVLGELNPPRPLGISTDRLGPERGQPVPDYLTRARDSLAGAEDGERWALVSFTEEIRPEQIPAHSGGLRIAQVLHRVPIADAQPPLVAVQVPAGDGVAVASADAAAWQLLAVLEQTDPAAVDARYRDVVTESARGLRAGCACTVGLVVRGPLPRLRELAAADGVRAVEALPADAVAGQFAVSPLIPARRDLAATRSDPQSGSVTTPSR